MREKPVLPRHEWVVHEARIVPELVAWRFNRSVWVSDDESPVALITWHLHMMEPSNLLAVDQVRTSNWLATRTLLAYWTPTLTVPEWTPSPSPIESIDKLGDEYEWIIFLPRGQTPSKV